MLGLMQAGQAITESRKNVLHLDETKLNFGGIGSFQVVTECGTCTYLWNLWYNLKSREAM